MKRLTLALILTLFTLSCFAGYYSGGRSGFSSGGRSFSSARTYSAPRASYSRAASVTRTYVAPRSNYTTVHHNYYAHHGLGMGGGGFFSGFLGGFLGGSLANHNNVVVAGASALPQGQGMMMESGNVVSTGGEGRDILLFLIIGFVALGVSWLIIRIYNEVSCHHHSRW
jgi:hypothetical protein